MAVLTKREVVNNYSTVLTNAPGVGGATFTLSSVVGLSAGMAAGTTDWYATAVTNISYHTASEAVEIFLVTDVSGNDATVTRAQFGTTALDLAAGDNIEIRPIADHLNQLQDALINGLIDINVAGFTSNGNIAVTGTVDGRDVATDGTKLDGITGTNTGDEVAATASVAGVSELATSAEVTTGTDTTRAITPEALTQSSPTVQGLTVVGDAEVTGAHLGLGRTPHATTNIDVQADDTSTAFISMLNSAGTSVNILCDSVAGEGRLRLRDSSNADTITFNGSNGSGVFDGGVEVGGDLTLGASGVDKAWSTFIPASAISLAATNPAGALAVQVLVAGDTEIAMIPFDPDANEFVAINFIMPDDYDGSELQLDLYWTALSASGNVDWSFWIRSFTHDDSLTATHGFNSFPTATLTAANDLQITTTTKTVGGSSAGGDLITMLLQRAATAGSDTLTVDAQLIGIKLSYS